jgi:hypothetical protein
VHGNGCRIRCLAAHVPGCFESVPHVYKSTTDRSISSQFYHVRRGQS